MNPFISVIIPVWKEQEIINHVIGHIRQSAGSIPVEIIVIDGSPECETIACIKNQNIKKVKSHQGRGIQMNIGAMYAKGEVLLFLHADTILPHDAFDAILNVFKKKQIAGGAFDLGIDASGLIFRMIETIASWRSRLTRIPYGDQAIFLRKHVFKAIGGYKAIPIMEEIELMQRLKKKNFSICIIPQRVKTSARKWQQEGVLYCTLRNWWITFLFFAGVSPYKLTNEFVKLR